MFTTMSNASKAAFIYFNNVLIQKGVKMIDCQTHTKHLESLGAEFLQRSLFNELLENFIVPPLKTLF